MLLGFLLWCSAAALQDGEAAVKAGMARYEQEDYAGALKEFNRALAAEADRVDALIGRARARFMLQQQDEALKDLTRAIELDPTSAEAHLWRGRALQLRGNQAAAALDYARCAELGCRNPAFFGWQAGCLGSLGRYPEAESACDRAIEAGDHGASVFTARGIFREVQLNFRGAVSDLTRALQAEPGTTAAWYSRAIAYYAERSWGNAVRDFQRAAARQDPRTDMGALWVYLARSRMGEGDAALKELKADLAARPEEDARERKLLLHLAGELPEREALKLAEDPDPDVARRQKGLVEFVIASRALIGGREQDAEKSFRQSAETLKALPAEVPGILARAELVYRQRRFRSELVERLETALKSQKRFEAVYDLDLGGKPSAEDEVVRSIRLRADFERMEAQVLVTGENTKAGKPVEYLAELRDAVGFFWSRGRPESDFYMKMDMTLVRDVGDLLGGEIRKLLPPEAAAKTAAGRPSLAIALGLEGKPSATELGTVRFSLGLGSRPGSWLQEADAAEDAVIREEGEVVIFDLPGRRKKIVVDRKTGLLQRLEARDYDGTVRAWRRVSVQAVEAFPPLERPKKLKPTAFDLYQYRDQMRQQEGWLLLELGTAFENWEELAKAGTEKEALAIFSRWAARYADGLHAYAVRTLAGRRIDEALKLGTQPADLLQNFKEEAERFRRRFSEERKAVDEFMKAQLQELAVRTETGLYEQLLDARLHDTIRSTLQQAFEPSAVEALRRQTYGDRLESLLKEELQARTQL